MSSSIDASLIPDKDEDTDRFRLGEADPDKFDFDSKEARYYLADYSTRCAKSTTDTQTHNMNKYLDYLEHMSVEDPIKADKDEIYDLFIYLNKEGRALKTMKNYRSMIYQFHEFIESQPEFDNPTTLSSVIKRIPCEKIADKKHTFQREPISREEVGMLYNAANNPRNELIARVLYELGLRNEDLQTLKIGDIDFENRIITVGQRKGEKGTDEVDELPVRDELLIRLKDFIEGPRKSWAHADDHDFLFPSRDGEGLSGVSVRRIIKGMAEEAGIQETIGTTKSPLPHVKNSDFKRVTPHTLRHSIVTHLAEKNLPPDVIKFLTGHSSEAIHEYIHEDDTTAKDLIRRRIE